MSLLKPTLPPKIPPKMPTKEIPQHRYEKWGPIDQRPINNLALIISSWSWMKTWMLLIWAMELLLRQSQQVTAMANVIRWGGTRGQAIVKIYCQTNPIVKLVELLPHVFNHEIWFHQLEISLVCLIFLVTLIQFVVPEFGSLHSLDSMLQCYYIFDLALWNVSRPSPKSTKLVAIVFQRLRHQHVPHVCYNSHGGNACH